MKKSRLKPKVHIELTSLVDVMFILLIFFIFSYNKMKVTEQQHMSLPEASKTDRETLDSKQTINIKVYQNGSIFIENTKLTLEKLKKYIEKRISKDSNIVISAESTTSLQNIISVMDTVKLAGYTRSPYIKTTEKAK